MRRVLPLLLSALLASGCGEDANPADSKTSPPLTFERPESGTPIPDDEIASVTDDLIDLLDATHYFDTVRLRAHGWPRSDPQGRTWYGSWWSGVSIVRDQGKISFVHSEDGADNNGLRTAPLLEGALFAYKLWGDPNDLLLVRKLVRGFSSWILAMESKSHPDAGVLMTRASYPEPIESTDDGVEILFDYSKNRPGIDNGATQYVHIPDNPTWGDIWVKNMRSKDDIGHMTRALGQTMMLRDSIEDAEAVADIDQTITLYRAWAERVESDGWTIATYDADLNVYTPPDALAHLILIMNGECNMVLTLHLLAHGSAGEWDCGNGITDGDRLASATKSDTAQLLRSYHEAVVAHAQAAGKNALSVALLGGLAERVETALDMVQSDNPPNTAPNEEDMAELIVESANVGLPLTWREARFLQDRIRQAHETYLDGSQEDAIHALDQGMPDGTYPYQPHGKGFFFRNIGAILGLCASPMHNETSKPAIDCDRLRAATR